MTFRDNILGASYEGIRFPVSMASTETTNDAVEHTAYRVPGADIEPTGRAADRGTLTVPLHNDLQGFGELYPATYTRLIEIIKAKPLGDFVHPTRGPMTALMKTVKEDVSGDERDGITLTIQWIEHNATAQSRGTDPAAAPERNSTDAMLYLATLADTEMALVDTRLGFPQFPISLRILIDDALADLNDALSLVSTIGAIASTFTLLLDAIEERMAYDPYSEADAYDAFAALMGLRYATQATRDVYLPPAIDMRQYTVPSTMTIFDVAQNVYGDATQVSLLLNVNPIADPMSVPRGMVLVVPPLT